MLLKDMEARDTRKGKNEHRKKKKRKKSSPEQLSMAVGHRWGDRTNSSES